MLKENEHIRLYKEVFPTIQFRTIARKIHREQNVGVAWRRRQEQQGVDDVDGGDWGGGGVGTLTFRPPKFLGRYAPDEDWVGKVSSHPLV